MKLALHVEGYTERALPAFLKRWLDPKLSEAVRIAPINLLGSGSYLSSFANRVTRDLASGRLTAAVGLLDLYGLGLPFPQNLTTDEKYTWAKAELERRVGDARFRQHFAVHETEAWLLSDPAIFPSGLRSHVATGNPESVNFREPPSKLLRRIYRKHGREYKKTVDGPALFQKLAPERVYERCPHFRALLDDMLSLASSRMP